MSDMFLRKEGLYHMKWVSSMSCAVFWAYYLIEKGSFSVDDEFMSCHVRLDAVSSMSLTGYLGRRGHRNWKWRVRVIQGIVGERLRYTSRLVSARFIVQDRKSTAVVAFLEQLEDLWPCVVFHFELYKTSQTQNSKLQTPFIFQPLIIAQIRTYVCVLNAFYLVGRSIPYTHIFR